MLRRADRLVADRPFFGPVRIPACSGLGPAPIAGKPGRTHCRLIQIETLERGKGNRAGLAYQAGLGENPEDPRSDARSTLEREKSLEPRGPGALDRPFGQGAGGDTDKGEPEQGGEVLAQRR